MRKLATWIIVLVFGMTMLSCNGQTPALPKTPKGKALFLISVFNAQRVAYESRFPVPANAPDTLKNMLVDQRRVLVELHTAIQAYCEYIITGSPVPQTLILRLNQLIAMLEDMYVYREGVEHQPTEAQVKALMVKAGIAKPDDFLLTAESVSPTLIAALLELVKLSINAFVILQQQAQMDEAQIDTMFEAEWAALKAYNPQTLPEVS